MIIFDDMGGGGVKKTLKYDYIIYEWSLNRLQKATARHMATIRMSVLDDRDNYDRQQYEQRQKEIESLKGEIKTVEQARARTTTKRTEGNDGKPFQQTERREN